MSRDPYGEDEERWFAGHDPEPQSYARLSWLVCVPRASFPDAGQQEFGEELLAAHHFVLIPIMVLAFGRNPLFVAAIATGRFHLIDQHPLALDTRLIPPANA